MESNDEIQYQCLAIGTVKGDAMHPKLTPVQSSNIEGVWYSARKGLLLVAFNNGKTYSYSGVTQDTHDAFMQSPSKGQYLNREIKQNHQASLLSDEEVGAIVASSFRTMADLPRRHQVLSLLL